MLVQVGYETLASSRFHLLSCQQLNKLSKTCMNQVPVDDVSCKKSHPVSVAAEISPPTI